MEVAYLLNRQVFIKETIIQHEHYSNGHGRPDRLMIHNERFYDEDQLNAIALARSGKSFVLIGAAGSGKTTVERGIMLSAFDNVESLLMRFIADAICV